ncbi:MAG: type I methionyl aminopeptidase [Planctomycetes bacterium]|nr:type I methionyl aminopeptidase [Planctomycetota bacterium]
MLGPNDPCWCGSGRKYKRCHQPRDVVADFGREVGRLPSELRPVRPGRVSPRRSVPPHIPRPDYALRPDGRPGPRPKETIKTPEQIARMRAACRAAREVLEICKAAVRPGITTDELDRIAHEAYIARGGYPSTLGYCGFPKSICTSVNEVICHGIPDDRPLEEGDIVNIDVTIYLDGMHGDCSETVPVGRIDEASRRLIEVTRACLLAGIRAVRPGRPIRDIGRAICAIAEPQGYGVVRAFVGHGIGESFHMDPQVPHYDDPSATFIMRPGQTFTIEPMINQGTWKHRSWDDGWTAVTADLKRSAQHEHTVLVTEDGAEVLTAAPGEQARFVAGAELGERA